MGAFACEIELLSSNRFALELVVASFSTAVLAGGRFAFQQHCLFAGGVLLLAFCAKSNEPG
jgi:hypothetical protein